VENISIIHRRNQSPFRDELLSGRGISGLWTTCLRQILFTTENFSDDDSANNLSLEKDEIFSGVEAYRFCLEVISGLHSPILGETEVFGQFKKFFESLNLPVSPAGIELKMFFSHLIKDCKRVRNLYLKNTGSQSYGSILRRKLGDLESVNLLGSGNLAQSLLPWLRDKKVNLVVRTIDEKILNLKSLYPNIKLFSWSDLVDHSEMTVCAASVSCEDLTFWIGRQKSQPDVLIDLREQSGKNIISGPRLTSSLSGFFSEINEHQQHLKVATEAALTFIQELAFEKSRHSVHRPFGWEDLCV
jgi:glutamyl-tRNA reductase